SGPLYAAQTQSSFSSGTSTRGYASPPAAMTPSGPGSASSPYGGSQHSTPPSLRPLASPAGDDSAHQVDSLQPLPPGQDLRELYPDRHDV
ncbi:unnamed protein product, partial [Amoebophrya sp. A25]